MLKLLTIALAAMLLVTGSAHALTSLADGVSLGSTAASNSVCNSKACVMTTGSLSGASPSEYTVTITNSEAAATDIAICALVGGGTNTGGQPNIECVPGSGSVAVSIQNTGATAFNGTLKFLIWLIKP